MTKKRLFPHCILMVLFVFMASGNCLSAQETMVRPLPAASDDSDAKQVSEETGAEDVNRVMADSVRSMFQEKESPLLHIRWGTKIFVDTPIGNEPAGASYMIYAGWNAAILTVGVQDPPFSLEASGSSSSITFSEDALPGSEYDGLDPLIFALRAQWLVY